MTSFPLDAFIATPGNPPELKKYESEFVEDILLMLIIAYVVVVR
jgi:hypothetical protein